MVTHPTERIKSEKQSNHNLNLHFKIALNGHNCCVSACFMRYRYTFRVISSLHETVSILIKSCQSKLLSTTGKCQVLAMWWFRAFDSNRKDWLESLINDNHSHRFRISNSYCPTLITTSMINELYIHLFEKYNPSRHRHRWKNIRTAKQNWWQTKAQF